MNDIELNDAKTLPDENGGFTLVEIMVATSVLVIAVMAIAAIIVPLNRQREQVEAKTAVMSGARSLIEEIKGSDPEFIEATYDGQTSNVTGVDGANGDGTTLTATVDSTIPQLLQITVAGAWNISGHVETLELSTEIYNPSG